MNFSIYIFIFSFSLGLIFKVSALESKDLPFDPKQLPSKEIAIVQLSFDGINTFHCGVGTVVLQTQKALKTFNHEFGPHLHFKLYLISGDYAETLPEYSHLTRDQNIQDCTASGGRVSFIPLTKNKEAFGEPGQWEELCNLGAKICAEIIQENPYTIILAHDTAYAQLPKCLQTLCMKGEIEKPYQILWIPHATSWAYNGHTEEGVPKWPERHEWELSAFQQADFYDYKIGYISDTLRQDITANPFRVPEKALLFYRTGILLDPFLKEIPEEEVIRELKKRSIPLDKKLIFSIGRANPLKGQDITLEMYRHLKKEYSDIHLVMLAPLSDYMPDYLKILKERIAKEKLDVTLIDTFDAELAHFIYQWPKTVLVSLLSRMDTQPLTIMEARANPKNSIILTSDPERMGNQVKDSIDGFTCPLEDLNNRLIQEEQPLTGSLLEIVKKAKKIIDLSDEERAEIIQAGKKLIAEEYDFRKNLMKNFELLFSKEKTVFSEANFDPYQELTEHAVEIQDLFQLPPGLVFEKIEKGLINPPILVSTTDQNRKTPFGVFKQIKTNLQACALQLRLLSEIKSNSFFQIPRIFKDKYGCYVTRIGDHFYSLIEYIPADPTEPSFEEMLHLTGEFHHKTASLTPSEQIQYSKLDEFRSRSHLFSDPWFQSYDPLFFSTSYWKKVVELSHYFESNSFQLLYQKLPMQLIHGDNNQTNVLLSEGSAYLVDFDAVRIDVKLLDLATYFRYGGFEDYLHLSQKNKLLEKIEQLYGKYSSSLSFLEERHLHTLVAFSHLEFISWALKMLKSASLKKDVEKEREMRSYLTTYIDQINQLLPLLPKEVLIHLTSP